MKSVAIISMVVLMMATLLHHPVAHDHTYAQMVQLGAADKLVHGALIAMLAVLAGALTGLGNAAGARTAYHLGCLLLGVAMLLDGFVVPNLALQFMSEPADATRVAMLTVSAVIQLFSKAGLLAHCAAMLLWSWRERRLAAVGAAVAMLTAAPILFGDVRLTPHSLMLIFAVHAAWYGAAAWVLHRPSRPSASPT